jgi:hypothetical protein
MLELSDLERIMENNHFPGTVLEAGRTWVTLQLTDPATGLGRVETTSITSLMDLVLHWRQHGCHEHPCPLFVLKDHHS